MSTGAIERCWSWGQQQIATQPTAMRKLLTAFINIAIPVAVNKGGTGATTAAGARANLGIAPTGGFADAPKDGSLYGRRNAAWQAIVSEESFLGVWDVANNDPDIAQETPSGGQYFVVSVAGVAPPGVPGIGGQTLAAGDEVVWNALAGEWQIVPMTGIGEAPVDGNIYARQDAAWVEVPEMTLPVPIADGGTNAITAAAARTNLGVDSAISTAVSGVTQSTLGGPFVTTASLPTTLADYLPLAGGAVTGATSVSFTGTSPTLSVLGGPIYSAATGATMPAAGQWTGLFMQVQPTSWAGIYAFPIVGHLPTLNLLDLRDGSQNPLFTVGVDGKVNIYNDNGGDAVHVQAPYNPYATRAFIITRGQPATTDPVVIMGTGQTTIVVPDAGVTALSVSATGAGGTALSLNGNPVTFGAADSGGTGYRQLVVPN